MSGESVWKAIHGTRLKEKNIFVVLYQKNCYVFLSKKIFLTIKNRHSDLVKSYFLGRVKLPAKSLWQQKIWIIENATPIVWKT